MRLSDFDYNLPAEAIAQEPLKKRDDSRLLVLHRATGEIEHRRFYDLPMFLEPDDMLVMNNTRVTAVRLLGRKETGAKVEALLIANLGENVWEAMVKPGKRLDVGARIEFGDGDLSARVTARTEGGGRIIDFGRDKEAAERIERHGSVPLPPYIHKKLDNPERYQTVYAALPGSAAAPTAGLHFTPELIKKIADMGVKMAYITLDVGIATFRPVRTENVEDHDMHSESYEISEEAVESINSAKGRIIAVGTTAARALESAAVEKRRVLAQKTDTRLFITPGYEYKIVEGIITNYHIPRSTLLMMVSAFAGREMIKRSYEEALKEGYRFLSFGDAMLII